MNERVIKVSESELKQIVSDVVKKVLNGDRSRLDEMARVGFSDGYEIYIRTDDPGNIPHFHLRDVATQGREFETCIRLETNQYFHHGYYQGCINSKDRKKLSEFMESKNKTFNMSNYELACRLWNENNSSIKLNLEGDMAIPNYRQIEEG